MTSPIEGLKSQEKETRRDFMRTLGGGALGLSMLGGGGALAAGGGIEAEDVDFPESPEAAVTPYLLKVTDRQATIPAGTPVNILYCDPADCITPTQFHQNFEGGLSFTTGFVINGNCDELARIPLFDPMTLRWTLRPRYIRFNGPCGAPLATFTGNVRLRDPGGAQLFIGRVQGTLGFNPGLPAGSLRCCDYPLVMGTIFGNGVAGTVLGGCQILWSFMGFESNTHPCDPRTWDVGITGIVRCPCI